MTTATSSDSILWTYRVISCATCCTPLVAEREVVAPWETWGLDLGDCPACGWKVRGRVDRDTADWIPETDPAFFARLPSRAHPTFLPPSGVVVIREAVGSERPSAEAQDWGPPLFKLVP